MAQVVWSEPALGELDTIADYISLDNPIAASKLVRRVFDSVEQLHTYSKIGVIVDDLETVVYRKLLVPPCQIFYRVDGDTVFIVHIIRDEQLFQIDVLRQR